jgi:RND family efflux transporter MFP subunit
MRLSMLGSWLLLSGGLACTHSSEPTAPAARSLTAVKVHAVERSRADATARYTASIEPASRVDLVFKVSGYVDAIARTKGIDGKPRLLQEGDRVSRGLELASIRKQDYTNKLSEASAGLSEAQAAREQTDLDFERATRLHAGSSVSTADLDTARVRRESARARLDGARVRVEEARALLEDTELRAPMDGIVLRRSLEVGALAGPATVAFVIADIDSMKAVFGVPDTVRPILELGSAQSIMSEAFPNRTWSGRITRLAAVADPRNRLFDVEVTIRNADHQLKAGMIANLQLSAAKAEDAVAVLPLSALVRSRKQSDQFAVFALDESKSPPIVQLRDVELGQFLGNVIPVRAGLATGEKVVVQGASLLSDREAVRVIP